ncbi:RteC protein [Chitinophaga eiseniae]|uniref:RteC protein n=1 Tax=Chitinophaga eiseniae TaxID=634771 RepID=A0A1T4SXC5_9BACT|nr:RteC domain-containing protein [Chitinophaga eiseniae]SKA32915.1 RteC protein [Chitinophaga eiseniae]
MKPLSSYQQIMASRLHASEKAGQTVLQRCGSAIAIVEQVLQELNPVLSDTQFLNAGEEINFFKLQLPAIHAQLIYHQSVSWLESRKPVGDYAIHRHYYSSELDRIRRYSEDHRDFYQYHRTGATYWDEHLFQRGHELLPQLRHEYSFAMDRRINTQGTMLVATMQAYDLLREFIEQQTAQVDCRPAAVGSTDHKLLKWTDSKTALAEMIYAFWFKGSFNNGAAELKEIQAYVEQIFDIRIGNIYQIKQEMYARENISAYQDLLHKRFKEGMEQSL